jgi:tetratricopeptide (TPR) repeat protein
VVAFALGLGLAFAGEPIARADTKVDPDAQAKADVLFEKAQANYQGGSYQAAIVLFKQAYDLVHDPVYLFNLAQSYRRVSDCEAATDNYRQYLAESPKAENKAKVEQWLVELQPCVEQRKQEHEAARRAEELEKQRRDEEARKLRDAQRKPTTDVDRGGTLRIAGIATGAGGIALLLTGAVFSIHGASLKSDVASKCAPPAGCDWNAPDIRDLDSSGHRANTIAAIGYIGGGVAAIAGVALYMVGRGRVEHVTVTPAEGGATVSAQLRF